ncbi:XF1762 family protein [Kibdelosporangium aridum]|uniref:XF1762 family protein n=1 Tax=Kibdelosporangium aridum TaxID=2030 RepID=UPI000524740F
MRTLRIVPVTFRQACAFIQAHHRHHRPPRGMKFAVGVADQDQLIGVATVGRPVARHLDDGQTVEVTRTCTLGTRNANSMLYGAAWRTARAMGYAKLITYTQHGESGASLRAAGLRPVATLRARHGWDSARRRRLSHGVDNVERVRWEIQTTTAGMRAA